MSDFYTIKLETLVDAVQKPIVSCPHSRSYFGAFLLLDETWKFVLALPRGMQLVQSKSIYFREFSCFDFHVGIFNLGD